MLQLMGCLDKPTSGTVHINEQDVTLLNANKRADLRKGTIGFVFQFFALIPGLSAYENIELPLLLTGVKKEKRHERVSELLEAVKLSDRSQHRPDQMSGGEQQRVAVARAIAKRPQVLLCDEPTGALDISTGIVVLEALLAANRGTGTLTLVITHNRAIADMADRVVSIADGRIADVRVNTQRKSPQELSW